MIYIIALACVIGIAIGQILFKLAADTLHAAATYWDVKGLTILCTALALYGITTLGWVWVLSKADLGKVYPLMALAFVIVPIASYLFFGERFQPMYFVGVLLIMAGIVVTLRA